MAVLFWKMSSAATTAEAFRRLQEQYLEGQFTVEHSIQRIPLPGLISEGLHLSAEV